MAETKLANTIARERVEGLAEQGSKPGWLKNRRLSAWELYLQTPVPTTRDEQWKRTDIAALDLGNLTTIDLKPFSKDRQALPEWFNSATSAFDKAAGIVFQSSDQPGYLELSSELAENGVVLADLQTALHEHSQLLKPYFDLDTNPVYDNKFTLMNKALFNCGLLLYVPDNVEIKTPIISAISTGKSNGAIFPRLLVIAGRNSKVTLLHILHSDCLAAGSGTISLAAPIVETHIQDGAQVSFLELEQLGAQYFSMRHTQNQIARDGQLNSLTIALGGKVTKSDIATLLQAPGATSEVLGIILGNDNEHYNFNTIQEHNAPDTTSDINFRVALKDAASSVYQGIIKVAKVAQRTSAYQSNKNLLLGTGAHADSIPKLEILADDVKCSHGATVGPVDQEQIFYLNSRGLTPMEAEELIVMGFFRQILERFGIPGAVDWLGELVSKKIYQRSSDKA